MNWSYVLLLLLSVLGTAFSSVDFTDADTKLIRGVLQGNIQAVYESLKNRGNASACIDKSVLKQFEIPLPWKSFTHAPLLHIAFGMGTEQHYKIALLLAAAGARFDDFGLDFAPPVLYALGMGKEFPSEDLATSLNWIYRNSASGQLNAYKAVNSWTEQVDISHRPPAIHFPVAANFFYGLYVLLESEKMDINEGDIHQVSPLHLSSYYAFSNIMDYLLHHGANPMMLDDSDRSPLHYAVIRGHTSIVRNMITALQKTGKSHRIRDLLLQKDTYGYTCLDIVRHSPINKDCVNVVEELYSTFGLSQKTSTVASDLHNKRANEDLDDDDEDDNDLDSSNNVDFSGLSSKLKELSTEEDYSSSDFASNSFSNNHQWHCSKGPTDLDLDLETSIDTRHASALSTVDFLRKYMSIQRPLLIKGNLTYSSSIWSSIERNQFKQRFGDLSVRPAVIPYADLYNRSDAQSSTSVSLSQWIDDMEDRGVKPTCSNVGTKKEICQGGAVLGSENAWIVYQDLLQSTSANMNSLLQAIDVPSIFKVCGSSSPNRGDDWSELAEHPSIMKLSHKVELSIGTYGSGTPAHVHEAKWNVLLFGRKHWYLLPPGSLGSKKRQFSESGHSLTHIDVIRNMMSNGKAFHALQEAGDVIYVPAGWTHLTINSCESASISFSMCSSSATGDLNVDSSIRHHENFPIDLYTELNGAIL